MVAGTRFLRQKPIGDEERRSDSAELDCDGAALGTLQQEGKLFVFKVLTQCKSYTSEEMEQVRRKLERLS